MRYSIRLFLSALVVIAFVGCDQATKALARETLASSPPVSLLGGAVLFQYAENPGAFLSLGAGLSPQWRFVLGVVVSGAALAALAVFILRSTSLAAMQRIGLGLVVAGGLGNLVDRLANDGRVVDFVSVGIGSLRTGIFNVADMAITAGVLAAMVAGFRREKAG
ncbi:MAG TPA: signal peptidase II [Thermoanaerobaculia bacterium]|jgi:signal peptidase II|nr:signal peptidase II [Thermoanaerobaculia bacterium]